MSTRFYPRFVKGNPQLRIFLPDWRMIMIKSKKPTPDNVVSFKVDPKMTDWDVKNYLEKIYKVKVGAIRSTILSGPLEKVTIDTGIAKKDDYKIVEVTLPLGQTFNWPDLFPEEKITEKFTETERLLDALNKGRRKDASLENVPSWFL